MCLRRPDTRIRVRSSIGLLCLGVFSLLACSKSDFQHQHDIAVGQNPALVELELRTAGDKTKYKPGEIVEFEELYTSKYPGQWHIESSESFNFMGYAHIAYRKSILQPQHLSGPNVCCFSKHVWLSLDTTHLPTFRSRISSIDLAKHAREISGVRDDRAGVQP